jgi:hypothetical protein
MPCFVTSSHKVLHRLKAIQKIRESRLNVVRAAELLRLQSSR